MNILKGQFIVFLEVRAMGRQDVPGNVSIYIVHNY
jgi:hypothetical protein